MGVVPAHFPPSSDIEQNVIFDEPITYRHGSEIGPRKKALHSVHGTLRNREDRRPGFVGDTDGVHGRHPRDHLLRWQGRGEMLPGGDPSRLRPHEGVLSRFRIAHHIGHPQEDPRGVSRAQGPSEEETPIAALVFVP